MTPGWFYAKSDHELNTKVEKNISRFLTVVYTPTNNRRFRCYDFSDDDGVAETVFWTDCSIERKIKSVTVMVGFFLGSE
jgi:hypothetical protein